MIGSLAGGSGRHRQRLFVLPRQFFSRNDLPEPAQRDCRDARQKRGRRHPAHPGRAGTSRLSRRPALRSILMRPRRSRRCSLLRRHRLPVAALRSPPKVQHSETASKEPVRKAEPRRKRHVKQPLTAAAPVVADVHSSRSSHVGYAVARRRSAGLGDSSTRATTLSRA